MARQPESDGPPLKELVRSAEVDDKQDSFPVLLGGHYYLKADYPRPTWRHKLYWFLRSLIDWIHP